LMTFFLKKKMVRQTVREFVNEEVLPIIEHHNQAMTFPKELIPQMAELECLVLLCPKNTADWVLTTLHTG